MLLAIKTLLFLVSFIFASLIFFAVNFGAKSCFFATPGLNTASLPVPWWVSAFRPSHLPLPLLCCSMLCPAAAQLKDEL